MSEVVVTLFSPNGERDAHFAYCIQQYDCGLCTGLFSTYLVAVKSSCPAPSCDGNSADHRTPHRRSPAQQPAGGRVLRITVSRAVHPESGAWSRRHPWSAAPSGGRLV